MWDRGHRDGIRRDPVAGVATAHVFSKACESAEAEAADAPQMIQLRCIVKLLFAGNGTPIWSGCRGERVAENASKHEPIRTRRQPMTGAQMQVGSAELEIRDEEKAVLLRRQGRKPASLTEVRIIFDADCDILGHVSRQSNHRREIGHAFRANANIDNGVDDEFEIVFSKGENGAD